MIAVLGWVVERFCFIKKQLQGILNKTCKTLFSSLGMAAIIVFFNKYLAYSWISNFAQIRKSTFYLFKLNYLWLLNKNYPNSDALIWIHIIWNCIWTWVRVMLLFTLTTKTILYTGDSLSQSLNVILNEVILTRGVKLQSHWPHLRNLSRIFCLF